MYHLLLLPIIYLLRIRAGAIRRRIGVTLSWDPLALEPAVFEVHRVSFLFYVFLIVPAFWRRVGYQLHRPETGARYFQRDLPDHMPLHWTGGVDDLRRELAEETIAKLNIVEEGVAEARALPPFAPYRMTLVRSHLDMVLAVTDDTVIFSKVSPGVRIAGWTCGILVGGGAALLAAIEEVWKPPIQPPGWALAMQSIAGSCVVVGGVVGTGVLLGATMRWSGFLNRWGYRSIATIIVNFDLQPTEFNTLWRERRGGKTHRHIKMKRLRREIERQRQAADLPHHRPPSRTTPRSPAPPTQPAF